MLAKYRKSPGFGAIMMIMITIMIMIMMKSTIKMVTITRCWRLKIIIMIIIIMIIMIIIIMVKIFRCQRLIQSNISSLCLQSSLASRNKFSRCSHQVTENVTISILEWLLYQIISLPDHLYKSFGSISKCCFSRSYVVILVTVGYISPLSIIAFSYFGIIKYFFWDFQGVFLLNLHISAISREQTRRL